MKKIYFGINGQFGDIIIQEPTLRKVIEMNPDSDIWMGAYKKYFEILELYKNYHPNIKGFIEWEKYTTRYEKDGSGNWPSENDKKKIEEINFDKMYEVSPIHKESDWVTKRHIVEELGNMYNIKIDNNKVNLNKPEHQKSDVKTAAISLFPSSWGWKGPRSISIEKIKYIVSFLTQKGYKVLHLGGPGEPDIKGATKIKGSYIDSVKALLSTELLVTCDTGMSWIASAYNHPTIGLYSWAYNSPDGGSWLKNWKPINPNASYLESKFADGINVYNILYEINKRIK